MFVSLKSNRGFTLIELMVTIAIAGVLLAVGIPSFQGFISNSNMAATNNAMVYSIQLARSTSMERLSAAGVCASNSPSASDAGCDAGAGYASGWIVYADDNGNGARDAAEDILERVEAPGNAFTFTPDAVFENQIYFNDSGASINVANVPISGQIKLEYGDGEESRRITVSANGRVSTETL